MTDPKKPVTCCRIACPSQLPLQVDEDSLALLGEIGESTSLRHAVRF